MGAGRHHLSGLRVRRGPSARHLPQGVRHGGLGGGQRADVRRRGDRKDFYITLCSYTWILQLSGEVVEGSEVEGERVCVEK